MSVNPENSSYLPPNRQPQKRRKNPKLDADNERKPHHHNHFKTKQLEPDGANAEEARSTFGEPNVKWNNE